MCKNKILFLYVAGIELVSLTLTAEHAMNCAKMQPLQTNILNCMWNSCTGKRFFGPVNIGKRRRKIK